MSTRMMQYSKSPRSVTSMLSHESLKGCPSFPKLACDDQVKSTSTTRSLRKMHRVVRIWRCHSLDSRNISQKQRNARRVRRNVTFPTNMSSAMRIRQFDSRNSVLSVSDPSKGFTEDVVPQTPWYEQEYEEMPWWEYPGLDEDDEITVMCKKVARNKDPAYVERVEALVWTAVVKLQNVARFVLQQQQTKRTSNPNIKTTQPPASSQQRQTKARAEIPSMFVGLPREVQAEKRRYRRAASDIDKPEKPTVTKPLMPSTQPAAVAAPRRVIRRTVATSSKKSSNVDVTPTPAAVFSRALANPVLPATKASPKVYSSPANPTKLRIQKLKEQQRAMKEEQERADKKKSEQQDAAQRLEAQQRRLERLKKRSVSSS